MEQIQSLADLKLAHDEWGHLFAGLAALVRMTGFETVFTQDDIDELRPVTETVTRMFQARNSGREETEVAQEVKRLMLALGNRYIETRAEVE